MKDFVCGVHQVIYPSKSAISIFRAIVGYIKRFQQRGFWLYQAIIVNWLLSYVFWKYKWMCHKNRNERLPKIEMNKPLETNEQIVGNSWAIFSIFPPSFYGVILVLSSDIVNSIFYITLIISVKYLPRDLCYG